MSLPSSLGQIARGRVENYDVYMGQDDIYFHSDVSILKNEQIFKFQYQLWITYMETLVKNRMNDG